MNTAFRTITLVFVIAVAFTMSAAAQSRFDACLGKDVSKDDFVAGGSAKVTVKEKLIGLKARCRRGKLVDAKRREIRFFRNECWGNPPADYLEIQKLQQQELARLKKKYTVVEIACGPNIMSPH